MKTYLVMYGPDDKLWACLAEDTEDAMRQFQSWPEWTGPACRWAKVFRCELTGAWAWGGGGSGSGSGGK